MRKERDERRVGQQSGIDPIAAFTLRQEHDLLEGEEADGQRQENVQLWRVQPQHTLDQKVCILEPTEQRQVRSNAGDQPASRRLWPATACKTKDLLTEAVVRKNRSKQQENEFRIPPAIEEQA